MPNLVCCGPPEHGAVYRSPLGVASGRQATVTVSVWKPPYPSASPTAAWALL